MNIITWRQSSKSTWQKYPRPGEESPTRTLCRWGLGQAYDVFSQKCFNDTQESYEPNWENLPIYPCSLDLKYWSIPRLCIKLLAVRSEEYIIHMQTDMWSHCVRCDMSVFTPSSPDLSLFSHWSRLEQRSFIWTAIMPVSPKVGEPCRIVKCWHRVCLVCCLLSIIVP